MDPLAPALGSPAYRPESRAQPRGCIPEHKYEEGDEHAFLNSKEKQCTVKHSEESYKGRA